MHESVNDYLMNIEGHVKSVNNEIAFPMRLVQKVYNVVFEKKWIILGGDILTPVHEYTYDSWYYEPHMQISLFENVQQSIHKSKQYISTYQQKHGEQFFVVFTISGAYVDGRINNPS